MTPPITRCFLRRCCKAHAHQGGRWVEGRKSSVTRQGVSRWPALSSAQMQRVTATPIPTPRSQPGSDQEQQGSPKNSHLMVSPSLKYKWQRKRCAPLKSAPEEGPERRRLSSPSLVNFLRGKVGHHPLPPTAWVLHSSSRAQLMEKIIQKTLRSCPRCYSESLIV